MGIVILEQRLKIVNIPKSHIHLYTHSLIKIVFFNENREKFFSYTETDNEFSVVVDEKNFKELPTVNSIDTGHTWLALQLTTGDDDDGKSCGISSKIANLIILPLADEDISVYCISSYQTDFILIREQDVTRVINCLRTCSNCSLYREENGENVTLHSPPASPTPLLTGHRPTSRPITHPLHLPSERYYLATLTIDMMMRDNSLILIQTLFYPNFDSNSSAKFFSFSLVHKEISLILDEETLHRFPQHSLLYDLEAFKMIKVGGHPLGFDECGIVAQISQPITESNIPEYYISTFLYDHTFVPEENFDQVLSLLHSKQRS